MATTTGNIVSASSWFLCAAQAGMPGTEVAGAAGPLANEHGDSLSTRMMYPAEPAPACLLPQLLAMMSS